jgi:hypothetical protein
VGGTGDCCLCGLLMTSLTSCVSSLLSKMVADLFILCTDIHCVCSLVQNRTNLGASSRQVPDKFWTSFGQVRTSFVLKLVRERDWIVFFMHGYSCVCILVQILTNLGASSGQVPDKFQTSSGQVFFKLVHQLSKNIKLVCELSEST